MNDSNLNFVLLQTRSKYIIVVKDLDRFLTEKLTAVSLFVDVHIHFPLCDFLALKMLANSYLKLKDNKHLSQVENIFHRGASLSSAEISDLIIANWNSPSRAIKLVIKTLQTDGNRRGVGKIRSRLGNNATPNTNLFLIKIKIRNKILVYFFSSSFF
jgi:hypothetical protein